MTKLLICECNNTSFAYFGTYCRCPNCYNEYKFTKEYYVRRFDKDTMSYGKWIRYNNKGGETK